MFFEAEPRFGLKVISRLAQPLEKQNNKETEKKMPYKQCIEARLQCLRRAIWSPVLHLFSSMLVSHFDSDILSEL